MVKETVRRLCEKGSLVPDLIRPIIMVPIHKDLTIVIEWLMDVFGIRLSNGRSNDNRHDAMFYWGDKTTAALYQANWREFTQNGFFSVRATTEDALVELVKILREVGFDYVCPSYSDVDMRFSQLHEPWLGLTIRVTFWYNLPEDPGPPWDTTQSDSDDDE
ncbi:MAG: hypothetical protein KBB54_01175 [Candidatus Pacebacteria bacterium]|nr:hypothetical protein [Candidatus Paceibacterota bacterium]MBP9818475.1 hypothetical protein [Candidatus Paceibacterota bacterium]